MKLSLQANHIVVLFGKATGNRWDQKNSGRWTHWSKPFLSTMSASIMPPWELCCACRDILVSAPSPAATGSQSWVEGHCSLLYTFILFSPLGHQESIRQHWWKLWLGSNSPLSLLRGWGQLSPCSCSAPCPQAQSRVLSCTGARGELPEPPAPTHLSQ